MEALQARPSICLVLKSCLNTHFKGFHGNDQLDFGTSPQHYYDIEPSLSKELLKQTAPYLTSIKGLWCKLNIADPPWGGGWKI